MATASRASRPDGGFTLIEVLVALLVLGTVAVAVLQLFGGGLRLARAAGDHADAILLASAKLAELEPGPLEEGSATGETGPFRWTRRVSLEPGLLPVEPNTPDTVGLKLARVTVEVRWGASRQAQLVTLRSWRPGSTPGATPSPPPRGAGR